MKAFMEEYGTVVVVAIVTLSLIGVGLFFRTQGTESIRNITKGFMNQAQLSDEGGSSDSDSGGGSGDEASETDSGSSSGEEETPKATIKTVTAGGVTIEFEEGMTWGEWLNSDYCKGNEGVSWHTDGYGVYKQTAVATVPVTGVSINDVIQADGNYKTGRPMPF